MAKSCIQACCVWRVGLAEQAAGKLPPLVSLSAHPHPSDQQHPSGTPSWEQHITQGPLQVWHQATSVVMSCLPRFYFPSKASQRGAPAEAAAGGLHAWHRFQSMSFDNLSQGVERGLASCWQTCQRAAEGLPQLVPKKGMEEGKEQVRLCWNARLLTQEDSCTCSTCWLLKAQHCCWVVTCDSVRHTSNMYLSSCKCCW